uniref:Uncharacterized protein n=1 Tax=Ursus americanus TaxID=9643 RepID=A0A452RF69_URSAM
LKKIKSIFETVCWRGCEERGSLLHCWWECKLVQPLWKTVWRPLKKLKIELPYDPAIALLGIYPKDTDIVKRRFSDSFFCSYLPLNLPSEFFVSAIVFFGSRISSWFPF